MGPVIVIYIIGFIINAVVAFGIADINGDKQLAARVGLLSPVWPVTLAYGLYLLVRWLWKESGWSLVEKDKV